MTMRMLTRRFKCSAITYTKPAAAECVADEKNRLSTAKGINLDEPCQICQEPAGLPNSEGVIEGWSRLPCGHRFGSRCIKHWLGMLSPDERAVCPLCRRNATHMCGHPVLPRVIDPNDSDDSDAEFSRPGAPGAATTMADDILRLDCEYCLEQKRPFTFESREQVRRSRSTRLRRWVARKLIRRSIADDELPAPPTATTVVLMDGHQYTAFGANHNVWYALYTPFESRVRDPGWERWWASQEPQGA